MLLPAAPTQGFVLDSPGILKAGLRGSRTYRFRNVTVRASRIARETIILPNIFR